MPGAGKTTRAEALVADGYTRLNRDERGGTLAKLVPALERDLASGRRHVVLDNTYATRATRSRVIEAAWRHRVPVRCTWVATSLEDCQINAVVRMMERHGRLLDDDAIRALPDDAPNTFTPRVQYRYREQFETPREDEGFTRVDVVAFERRPLGEGRALYVDGDTFLWPDGAEPVPHEVRAALSAWHDAGYALVALSWAPQLATPTLEARAQRATEALGLPLSASSCSHPAGPPVCWCRPPLPGLVVAHAFDAKIDLARSRILAVSPAFTMLAARTGVALVSLDERP